jgi:hypothetical protein
MKATLFALALNELLDRALNYTLQSSLAILPSPLCHNHNSFVLRSGLTPELTRREVSNQAFNLADESRAHSARVE